MATQKNALIHWAFDILSKDLTVLRENSAASWYVQNWHEGAFAPHVEWCLHHAVAIEQTHEVLRKIILFEDGLPF